MSDDDNEHVWWAAYHVSKVRTHAYFADKAARSKMRRLASSYLDRMAEDAVEALTYTLLALGYGPCPDCDGAGTVEVGQHRGHPLTGGGGTPIEAPCERCRPEERRAWEERR